MQRTVAGKLTLLIAVSLGVFFLMATWLNLAIQERAGMRILSLNGAQIADLVGAATREAMLVNDRERIQRTIDAIAEQREIERIRVIEKGGRIAHSTEPTEIGTFVDPRAEQCQRCHQQPQPPEDLSMIDRARVVNRPEGRVLGITQVIRNEADCSTAPCHAHAAGERLLGVLEVNLEMGPYDSARMRSVVDLLAVSLLGIAAVLMINVVAVRRMVHRPVSKLIAETAKLGEGDLSVRVPEVSRDELGTLAGTFNRMARELEAAHAELVGWAETLEARVAQKGEELQLAQEQIVRVERMASLGKLAAVVAHEINNPLSSVVTYAKLLVRRLESTELSDECRENLEYLESIAAEAARCGEIVAQLLAFARRRGGEFSDVDLNQVVERSLFLIKHKMELGGVVCGLELASGVPLIQADATQIQQAVLAVLINASEALGEGGTIKVATRAVEDGVEVEIEDDGPGMAPEVAGRVFEPFFTTKSDSSGVGLGLAVVYGIVERHGGRIDLTTAVGEGCRFIIFLPAERGEAEVKA